MLYTGKGDDGTTTTFGCNQRISKSSNISEALGSMDEINSFLGICKVKARNSEFKIQDLGLDTIVHNIQENLFIIQAELAGANKKITDKKILEIEKLIKDIENTLPPIKTFFISGGTELGASFDVARTMARRAERRVIQVSEEGIIVLDPNTKKYMNRLSSLLYALARLTNHLSGINEISPSYN